MLKYISILFLIMLLFSCVHQTKPGTAVVSGVYSGAEGKILKLVELKTQRVIIIDSVQVDQSGNFKVTTLPAEKSFYLLQLNNHQPISIVLDKNDTISILMDTTTISRFYQLEGNVDSKLLRDYHLKTGRLKSNIDSLRKVLFDNQHLDNFYEIKYEIDSDLENLLDEHKNYTQELISDNKGVLANILLINQSFAGEQLFKIDDDLDLFLEIDTVLMKKFPDNSHAEEHHKRVNMAIERIAIQEKAKSRVSVGKVFPDINLPDVNGNQIKVSDLKGKNVIVFFWASWSPESRADLQQLKKIYRDFEKEKMEIYAVSLDGKEKYWKSAIKIEDVKWINVLDIYGMNGSISKLFNLNGRLPYYYLIDKDGIIHTATHDFTILKNGLIDLIKSLKNNSKTKK